MSFGEATKKAGKKLLSKTSRAAISIWNDTRQTQIDDIDTQIEELQKKRIQLVDELITEDDIQKAREKRES